MKLQYGILGAAAIAMAALGADAGGASAPLVRPEDLRDLVFLSSGHGMAYGPAREAAGESPPFTNVYVTRDAYRDFMKSGVWPEGATFFLEVRQGLQHVSINSGG